ncbi:MAG: hypothetical protein N2Z76_05490 [Treponemataceae bacterium]|nr:hypothetical protein [Treponemataceae bacterium]
MALLITSMGNYPEIIAEVLAFTNLEEIPSYWEHPDNERIYNEYQQYFKKDPVREVWVYFSTEKENKEEDIHKLETWNKKLLYPFNFIYFILPFSDIKNKENVWYAREVGFRLVKKAHEKYKNEKIYISIAAGRKTIASDLQNAGFFFGCDAFIHVLSDAKKEVKFLEQENNKFRKEEIAQIIPIFYGKSRPNPLSKLIGASYPINITGKVNYLDDNQFDKEENLFSAYQEKLERAANLFNNQNNEDLLENFPVLQQFNDQEITYLKNYILTKEEDIRFLPKLDLHCHLGGCLDIAEIVLVASKALQEFKDQKPFDILEARKQIKEIKENPYIIREKRYLDILKIISAFSGYENELETLWYGKYRDEKEYFKIGFTQYEHLGDLQGSSLLQNKTAIAETVKILIKKAKDDGCIGIEIRCSPYNYTKENLTYKEVLKTILQTVDQYRDDLQIGIILITSRHKGMNEINETIRMYLDILSPQNQEEDPCFYKLFTNYIRGFDVAGDESTRTPQEIRKVFIPILKLCVPITIHAGETQDADQIWEAVYELNADRIGHGLTLINNEQLLKKFLDRNIGLELCPSSNFQIVGYDDFTFNIERKNIYPLIEYLRKGLKVTINTDNRGISRTNLCKEFIKASHMTPGGLSLLDALQLCKNSIDISFFHYDEKRRLHTRAQEKLSHWLRSR